MNSLLLHICCGPCSTVPLRLLLEKGVRLSTLFYNPNINSEEEHELRLKTFKSFAKAMDIQVVETAYEPQCWEDAIQPAAGVFPLIASDPNFEEMREKRQARCSLCYAMRFKRLAQEAALRAFDEISTTLSISPYQFVDGIALELQKAAESSGVRDVFVDYRKEYHQSVTSSRELKMYRQNYCGCRFSRTEAHLERLARKSASAIKADGT